MSRQWEIWLGVLGIALLVVVVWVTVAVANYVHDRPARAVANAELATTAAAATTTGANGQVVVVQQPVQQDTGWNLFWYGYMFGWWGPNRYSDYRTETNNYYYSQPQYQSGQRYDTQTGAWAEELTPSAGSWGSDPAPSSQSSDSWGSGDTGSWGSDSYNSSSYDSWDSGSDYGSWGSDSYSSSYDSWDSGSSYGSWGE